MYGDKRGLHHGLVAVDESLRGRLGQVWRACPQKLNSLSWVGNFGDGRLLQSGTALLLQVRVIRKPLSPAPPERLTAGMFAECNNRLVHHTLQLYRNGFAQQLQFRIRTETGIHGCSRHQTSPGTISFSNLLEPFP